MSQREGARATRQSGTGFCLPWCSSKRASQHKERDPGERRRIVQKVGHDRGDQAAPPYEIGNAPHHAEECGGYRDPEPREKTLIQITCVREAERNAGNKDLRYLPVASTSKFCHQEGSKQHFFTESRCSPHDQRRQQVKSMGKERG